MTYPVHQYVILGKEKNGSVPPHLGFDANDSLATAAKSVNRRQLGMYISVVYVPKKQWHAKMIDNTLKHVAERWAELDKDGLNGFLTF